MATRRKAKAEGMTVHVISHGVEFDCQAMGERFVLDGEEFGSLGEVAERVKAQREQSSMQHTPTTLKPVKSPM